VLTLGGVAPSLSHMQVVLFLTFLRMHRVNWRHTNLWLHYDLYGVGQSGVLCEVKWWRFAVLFKQIWISWLKKMSVLSLPY